jgi:hypothetical protein
VPHKSKPEGVAVTKVLALVSTLLLCGCAAIPVQERTLRNANGGTITCKQVGTGIVSSSLGKERFDKCVADAQAQGYN